MEPMKKQFTVLVVDDEPANLALINQILQTDYHVKVAINGEKAMEIAQSEYPPDLVLLDIMMPGIDGYEVCRRLKKNPKTKQIPIVFLTGMSSEKNEETGLKLGAVDYITKPFNSSIVKVRVHNHIQLKQHQDHLEDLVKERTRELMITQDATINSLASLAETRDNETGGHIRRTQTYVKILATHLMTHEKFKGVLTPDIIEPIYKSAPLHDIGKVGVPDSILLKPGKLSEQEFEEIKKHTTYGFEAIQMAKKSFEGKAKSFFLNYAGEIAYTHHEKWDGTGYPKGLAGEDIPVSGRLMAVADVYDALITRRVYKPPFSHQKALAIMKDGKGSHFDPSILDTFLKHETDFKQIAYDFADSTEEREAL
ncbi:MAG: two-component system response regulator [Desulfobacteraceae bacterium]|nr:two-component system response regulator [Desulfobacteraceae bacterium]